MKSFLVILFCSIALLSNAKTISIETSCLVGDEIYISQEITLVVAAIGINKDCVFYIVEDKITHKFICLTKTEIEILLKCPPRLKKENSGPTIEVKPINPAWKIV